MHIRAHPDSRSLESSASSAFVCDSAAMSVNWRHSDCCAVSYIAVVGRGLVGRVHDVSWMACLDSELGHFRL